MAKSFFGDRGGFVADGALFGSFASFGTSGFFGPGDNVFTFCIFCIGVASSLDGHGVLLTADAAGLFFRASFGAGSRFGDVGLGFISGVLGFVDLSAIASLTFVPVIVVVGFPLGVWGSFVLVLLGSFSLLAWVVATGGQSS